jgi:hypothetical protein
MNWERCCFLNSTRKAMGAKMTDSRPFAGIKLAKLVQTCDYRPSQWEGETEDGKYVYIRYRNDLFYVKMRDEYDSSGTGEEHFRLEGVHGDLADGSMTTEEMLAITGFDVSTAREEWPTGSE